MGAKKPVDKKNSEAPRQVTKKAGYHMEVTVTKPGENGDETYNFNMGSFHVDTKVEIVKEMLETDTTVNAKRFWEESDKTCKPAIVFGDFNTRTIASDVIYDEAIGDIVQQGDRVWPIKDQTVQCCKENPCKKPKYYNELDMNLLFDRLKDSRVRDVTFRKMIGRSQLFQNGAYQEPGPETTCNLHPQFRTNNEPKPCYKNQVSPYGTISDLFFTNVHWWLQNPNKQIPWFTYKRMCASCQKLDDDTEKTEQQTIASLNPQWRNNAPENELAAPDGLIASFTNGFQEVGATIKKCTSKRRIVKDKDVDTKVLNLGWLDLFGLYDPTRTISGRNPLPASCTSRDTVEFLDVRTLTEVVVFDHVPTYAQIQLTLGEQFSEVSAEVSQTEYVTYDRLIILATFLSLIGVSLTLKCKKTSTDGLYSKLITEEEV